MAKKKRKRIDGCDVVIRAENATRDEDLPLTVGGVAFEENEDDIDGCDVPVREEDATPDEALPLAQGGVA